MITMLNTILTNPATAVTVTEQQLQECNEQISACEAVMGKAGTLIEQMDAQHQLDAKLTANLKEQLEAAKELQPKWYEKPGFVVPATVAATILGIVAIRRNGF